MPNEIKNLEQVRDWTSYVRFNCAGDDAAQAYALVLDSIVDKADEYGEAAALEGVRTVFDAIGLRPGPHALT